MNENNWIFTRIVKEANEKGEIEKHLLSEELSILEIKGEDAVTIVTTQRIIEIQNQKIVNLNIDQIDDVVYGNFKGRPAEEPRLSKFMVTDLYGEKYDFQMETGYASIALMKGLDTVLRIKRNARP